MKNFVFILADQHNAKVCGYAGHPDVLTPNLDRMAADGTRFDAAVVQNPICTPSRMCYISGQYAHNHGYYGLSGRNPGGLPTIFGHFRRHGYTTAAFGKIHCPEYWVEDDCDCFEDTCGTSIYGQSKAYRDFLEKQGVLDLEDHNQMPDFGPRGRQSMEGRPSKLTFEQSQEGWSTAQGIEFMQQAQAEKRPFLLHISLPRPHQCTSPSPEFWELYQGKKLSLPPNADSSLEGKAPHLRAKAESWRKGEWALIEPKTFEAARMRKLRGYLAAISQVDHAVGRIQDFLRQAGLDRDTVVIYAADHGDYACEFDVMEKAPGICSDAITRAPMLWQGAGINSGHIVRDVVQSIDVSATLCDLAGLPRLETSDGVSLRRYLEGESGDGSGIGVTEFPLSKSYRKGAWRLVYYPRQMFADEYPEGFGELYNLQDDPWEMNNLYFDQAMETRVTEMREELLDWLVNTTRPVTCLGKSGRIDDFSQLINRYKNGFYRDGKIFPIKADPKHCINYI